MWYNSAGALGTVWPECYYVNLCGTSQRGSWELCGQSVIMLLYVVQLSGGAGNCVLPECYYVNLCGTTQRGRWELCVAKVLLC